jgi:hypothetical protein
MVPGGGIEPPWNCFRRILSPFSVESQGTASDRNELHNPSVINGIGEPNTSHKTARNCTDYRNEHAPEQAPARAGNSALPKHPQNHPPHVEPGMRSASSTARIVDDLNKFRCYISKAEAAGSISPFFAARLRLMADKAEAHLDPPTKIELAFHADDKVMPFHGQEVRRG